MTDIFTLMMDGEIIRGIMAIFDRSIGAQIALFCFLAFFLFMLWLKTESFVIPFMFAVIILGAVPLSGLFASDPHYLLPSFADSFIYIVMGAGLGFILLTAFLKNR